VTYLQISQNKSSTFLRFEEFVKNWETIERIFPETRKRERFSRTYSQNNGKKVLFFSATKRTPHLGERALSNIIRRKVGCPTTDSRGRKNHVLQFSEGSIPGKRGKEHRD